MKLFKTSLAFIFGVITTISISNANAGGCRSHNEKKAEIKCLSEDKKCIELKEKKSQFNVEV